MKFDRSIKTLGGIAVASVILGSGAAQAGISATKHNLSTSRQYTTLGSDLRTDTTEICLFCHTPHMTTSKPNDIPLWNHQVSTVGTNYIMYSSATLNASIVDFDGPGTTANATVTTLCLSCHDGTVAINALYNESNMSGAVTCDGGDWDSLDCYMPASSNANLGTDLSNDHPVNFVYNDALATADGYLHDPDTDIAPVRLYDGRVQCASCHDPHIDYGADPDVTPFLRHPITGSALCLKCHNK